MIRRARARAGLALIAVSFVLAGCVSVPTSGPVRVDQPVPGAGAGVSPVVGPPEPGALPAAIVTGFLEANVSPTDNYAVARSYLAEEVRDEWNPAAGTTIYGNDLPAFQLTSRGATVQLQAPLNGTIDASDAYQVSPPGARLSTDFEVRRVDGEWRISGVRPGLLLTVRDIERDYAGLDRYFLNAAGSRLVPDRVLVSARRPGVQTTLVRGLLAGPSAWLKPAVTTAFPAGTQLGIDAVPLVGSTATVDLSTQALGADDATRRLLAAQIVWTLTSLEAVQRVRITVGGQPFPLPGVGDVVTRADFGGVDPNVLAPGTTGYAVVGQSLSVLAPGGAQPVPGAFGEGAVVTRSSAVNLDSTFAAATVGVAGATGTVFTAALREGSSPASRTRTGSVGSLSYSTGSELWVVDASTGGVRVVPAVGRTRSVAVEGIGRVVVARLARDGSRVALVVRSASGASSLLLARVVRVGPSVAFQAPRIIENQVSGVVDVAWVDADTIAVIGQTETAPSQVFQVEVGDLGISEFGGVRGMIRIAAAPGSPLLAEGTGGIWENSGSGWQLVTQARSPAYPG